MQTHSPNNPSHIDSAVTLLNERVVFPGDMSNNQIKLHIGDLEANIANLNLTFDSVMAQGTLAMKQEVDAWRVVLSLPPEQMNKILNSSKAPFIVH